MQQMVLMLEWHWCRQTTPPPPPLPKAITDLLQATCMEGVVGSGGFIVEQKRDRELAAHIQYLETEELPKGSIDVCRMFTLEPFFTVESVLIRINPKKNNSKYVAVPTHLRHLVMKQNHG